MEKKKIGEKVLLTRSDIGLMIAIDQRASPLKFAAIILWFIVVLFAGFFLIPEFLRIPNNWSFEKIFYSVLLAAWLFFLFKIGKLIVWRYMGNEVIQITKDELTINNKFGSLGKPQKFQRKEIRNFKEYPRPNDLLKNYFDYEFLATNGERFEFAYRNREYIFGKMLSEKEQKILEGIIRKEIRKK